MTKSRVQINYETMSDAQIEKLKIRLMERKLEALRIYQAARQCMIDVNADYDHKIDLINQSRDKLKRKDSNHRGMD